MFFVSALLYEKRVKNISKNWEQALFWVSAQWVVVISYRPFFILGGVTDPWNRYRWCPENSVRYYHRHSLPNDPEKRSSQLLWWAMVIIYTAWCDVQKVSVLQYRMFNFSCLNACSWIMFETNLMYVLCEVGHKSVCSNQSSFARYS